MEALQSIQLQLSFSLILSSQYSAAFDLKNAFLIYTFDEGSGDIVTDRSENGNDGLIGGGAKWAAGKNGKGLEMNGTSSKISSATANGVDKVAFTECLWVTFTNLAPENQFGYISCTETANARYFYFSSWSSAGAPNDCIHAGTLDGGGNWGRGISTVRIFKTKQWYFVAAVIDTKNGFIKIYVDGDMFQEQAIATGDTPGVPKEIWVGASPENYQWIGGTIDDVAFFNVALSENDLKSIMDEGVMESFAVDKTGKLSTKWGTIKSE